MVIQRGPRFCIGESDWSVDCLLLDVPPNVVKALCGQNGQVEGQTWGETSVGLWLLSVLGAFATVAYLVPTVAGAASPKQGQAPKPVISDYVATPSYFSSAGGEISLSADVTNASECMFTANQSVTGFPATGACGSGIATTVGTLAANGKKKSVTYQFTLSVVGSTVKKKVKVEVAAPANCSKIGHGADLPGCNLTDVGLSGAHLSNANLTDANLTGDYLSDANLTGANLSGANLTGVSSGHIIGIPKLLPTNWRLFDGYLIGPGANLYYANFSGADLANTDLAGTDDELTNYSNADLSGCDLSDTYFSESNLSDANLTDANLNGGGLGDAILTGANLTGASLSGANLLASSLANANLTAANLSDANMESADLTGANLANVVLNGVSSGEITGTPNVLPRIGP